MEGGGEEDGARPRGRVGVAVVGGEGAPGAAEGAPLEIHVRPGRVMVRKGPVHACESPSEAALPEVLRNLLTS